MECIEKKMDLRTLKQDKRYRKLYYWAVSRLSMMKPLYWSLVIAVAVSGYGLVSLMEETGGIPVEAWCYFAGLPVLAAAVAVIGMPRMILNMNLKRGLEIYGDSYGVMSNANGVSIHGKVIPWDAKYQRWEGKYGIAMTMGMRIVTVFPKHLYTEEEYQKLKGWMQLP